ncbi:uncharacterized protein BX664DRAFT_326109 [Halteromyces radiatus]|uniref:uncharacterized protein n=1 Tax=Halteromyces radiatus TaxID=101107 RepID=UPI00221F04AE|nr:uncharacterized protein BX664DRAFT_326109 [Halteromyces radiatus]KAI8097316.1 hypothetical protein BX664DRAFT_326109 [Halteromyces radiatus]
MASRLVLFLLTSFHLLGLTIFLKGFLLTRQTLGQRGTFYDTWDRFPLINDNNNNSDIQMKDLPATVDSPPAFKRVIVVVIDALRFDFMVQDESQQNRLYRNHLPIIDWLYTTQPDHTLLFQFRADPPTTTMQRIKGLMTGSLPTFIDAGSNFASSAVQEDHLLHHIVAQYPALYFMGDDTWQHLFPKDLAPERTFASDSFKMFDLHTVDNRIQEHLWPLLDNPESDWQVIITHFLGVDHCGHTFGPDHINMATKLEEMNTVLERLVKNHVNQDTLLVVMGDHGMSTEGDHGGESVEELMSGLLLYSGRKLTMAISNDNSNHTSGRSDSFSSTMDYFHDFVKRMYDTRASILGYDNHKITQRLHYNASAFPIVPQIHLVPTLAYLLHIPIPFGNLGSLVPDVLLSCLDSNDDGVTGVTDDDIDQRLKCILHMAQQFRLNALQVYDYLTTYGLETHHIGFTKTAMMPLIEHLETAEATMIQALNLLSNTDNNQMDTIELLASATMTYDLFLSSTIKYCEAIWAQFDVGCMLLGMMMLSATTVTGLFLWIRYTDWSGMQLWQLGTAALELISSYWIYIVSAILIMMSGSGVLFHFFIGSEFQSTFSIHWHGMFDKMGWMDGYSCMTGLVIMLLLITIIQQRRQKIQSSSSTTTTNTAMTRTYRDGCILLFAALGQALTLGSNSFVIWEDRGSRFASVTLCVWWLLRNIQNMGLEKNNKKSDWVSMVSSPFLVMLWTRLSGTLGQCREEQYPHCKYVDIGDLKQLDTGFWMTLLICTGGLLLVIRWMASVTTELSPWILLAYASCVTAVFIRMIDDVYRNISDKGLLDSMAFLFEDGSTVIWLQKSMDLYLPRYIYTTCLLVSIYMWATKKNDSIKMKQQYWLSYLCIWSTVLALLQRPAAGWVILLCPFIIYRLSTTDDHSIMIRLALIHLVGHHLFFVTGHQATFTSLPWHAAFIGFDDMYYYIGAMLVTLSTLTGYVVSWIGTSFILSQYQHHDDDNTLFMALLHYIPTCLSSFFVYILRRHLMTWKIFAPRFLLQTLLVTGTFIAQLVLGY